MAKYDSVSNALDGQWIEDEVDSEIEGNKSFYCGEDRGSCRQQ